MPKCPVVGRGDTAVQARDRPKQPGKLGWAFEQHPTGACVLDDVGIPDELNTVSQPLLVPDDDRLVVQRSGGFYVYGPGAVGGMGVGLVLGQGVPGAQPRKSLRLSPKGQLCQGQVK